MNSAAAESPAVAETVIYGASDDLIEIEGQLSEELNPRSDEPSLLAFSDGTLLEVEYDRDGIWRIKVLAKGTCDFVHVAGSVEDDTPDRMTMKGDLRWCVIGERGQYNPVWGKRGNSPVREVR
jgi:hypothetical protein